MGAGGRYDGLVETIGGPSTPGVGFALGIERLLTALDYENIKLPIDNELDIYIIPMNDEAKGYSSYILNNIRMNGFSCDIDYMSRNLKSNFRQADRLKAKYVIIVGEDEIKTKQLTIKNNNTKEEFKVSEEDIIEFFDEMIDDYHE